MSASLITISSPSCSAKMLASQSNPPQTAARSVQHLLQTSYLPARTAFRAALKYRPGLSKTRASAEPEVEEQGQSFENPDSEAARKKAEADRLRAAEKFLRIGSGKATCNNCRYVYSPKTGDNQYPVAPGTRFENLPEDWQCPVCGSEKSMFESDMREVAGFAENQGYGFGTNSMTAGQKSLLIFGSLLFAFACFISIYFIQ